MKQEHLDNEVRSLVKTIAHHKLPDVTVMIQQRCGKKVDRKFIEQCWKGHQA